MPISLIKSSAGMEPFPSGSHDTNACLACSVGRLYQHNTHVHINYTVTSTLCVPMLDHAMSDHAV